MTSDHDALGGPYRAIRTVRARDDGPWPGVLARTAGGESCVLVDAEILGADWSGWDAAADGHVLAPVDVARRADGHDVVLPVCMERLDDFVRRRAARMPLSSGEAVTLGVSVLRACAQLADAPDTTGEWWLDDAGRPVLATDAATLRALEASASVLDEVTVDARAQRTWSTALRAVKAARISVHELAAAEEALFAIAAAEPLATITLAPRAAGGTAVRAQDLSSGDHSVPVESAPRSVWQSLIAGVDDDLADTVSRATTAVWRRLRPTEPRRRARGGRAPWLVGGAVAVAVLTGGALWPTGGGEPDDLAATQPPHEGSPSAPPVDSAGGDGVEAPAAGRPSAMPESPEVDADLAAVTDALLQARLACADEPGCLGSVAVDPLALSGGTIDLPAGERTVTLLDDFGDIAVLRLDPTDPAHVAQMVVILRRDGKWLLRDFSAVAQQP